MTQDSLSLYQVANAFYREVGQHLTPHFQVTMIEPERSSSPATEGPLGAARLRLEDGDASVSVDFYPAMLAGLSQPVRNDRAKDAARELLRRWAMASQYVS